VSGQTTPISLVRETFELLMRLPLSELERYFAERDGQGPEVWNVVQNCDLIAERAARCSAYLNARLVGGNHAGAVRSQNAAAAGVRKALGYATARNDVTF